MAEVEDGTTIQTNGIDTEEMKTMIVGDGDALNDEPLHSENSQACEVALDKTKNGDLSEVEVMDEIAELKEQQEDGLSAKIENDELNDVEAMVEDVEDEILLDHKEIGINEEKPTQMVEDEAVEEQVIEDRTEDQVPDITGTDNADVMATSMDSIEELPTSEEQAIETLALSKQEAEPPIESGAANMKVPSTVEAEALTEKKRTSMNLEFEASQEINGTEAMLEEVAAEEGIAVNVEALRGDDKVKELPIEPNIAFSEVKFEKVEIQKVNEEQDLLKQSEPLEVTELTQQSLATNESETIVEEFFEAEVEETKKEGKDNERNKPDYVNLLNEEQQSKAWDHDAVDVDKEDSFASALLQEEKLEAVHSSPTSTSKLEETNDVPLTMLSTTKQEFASDEKKPFSKKSVTEDEVSLEKRSILEEQNSSHKTEEEMSSRKILVVKEKALSRQVSVAEDEKLPSRKTSRKSSAIQEAKIPSRKTSEIEVPSRKSSVTRKLSSEIEEKALPRQISKIVRVEEEYGETPEISPTLTEASELVRARRTKMAKTESNETKDESKPEPDAEEAVFEEGGTETIAEVPIQDEVLTEDTNAQNVEDEVREILEVEKDNEDLKYAAVDERESPDRQIISSPPRGYSPSIGKHQKRSPSPVRREENYYKFYDQDTHRQRGPPPRMPSYLSFSSYTPVEKTVYSPISPWVQNAAQKYRNSYTAVSTYRPPSTYTSIFDDIVASGPFASDLYSASRLLERSRSRSRELRNALRSRRSTSNYYRYTSNYATPPLRTRDYSTPPLPSVYRSPSRSSSFISFMQYSGQKQYELARSSSRFSAVDGLSRASSRSNIDMFYDRERLSRVDSYVRDLNRNVEYGLPSTYIKYRSPSRPYLPQEYTPIIGYRAYNSPLSLERNTILYTNPYKYRPISMSHNLYENYSIINSPSSSTLSRLYSGFARDWTMGS